VRALISLAVVAVAVIIQLTIVDRIAFPGGTGPDVVLLAVAALALANGPLVGALTGFWAGLALDVAPPGSHLVGQDALVFCLIGYACGLAADDKAVKGTAAAGGVPEQGHTALFEIVVTAAAAVCGEALASLLGVMLSDPRVTWPAIKHVLPVAAAYDVLLAPFVLYAVAAALRLAGPRGDRDRAAWSSLPARTLVLGAAQGVVRQAGTPNPPRLRLSDHAKGEAWIGGLRGQGAGRRPAAKREPRLKMGRSGSPGGGVLGAAFATGGSRRGSGLSGGLLLGGSASGSAALRSSRFGRSRMGRSLLGGSVFSRSSSALNRPARASRSAPLGRSRFLGRSPFLGRTSRLGWPPSLGRSGGLMRPVAGGMAGRAPRFAKGSSFGRLAGALRTSARPKLALHKSPGRGWLRRTSSRSGTIGRGAMAPRAMGHRAKGQRTMGRRAFGRGASGPGAAGRGWTGGSTPWRRTGRSARFGPARLRVPLPKNLRAKRRWRTGGYR
jgi:rod shape-determining protein MreD